MKKLRLFELREGDKELIEEVETMLPEKLDAYLIKYITAKYPVTSYTSFSIMNIGQDDHSICYEVSYSFKNSSYFSTRLLSETHTILLKEV